MKIYRKIVFDYNFNVIEEDSYEYEGEIALCDGDGGGQGNADAQSNSEASANNSGVEGGATEGSIGDTTSGFDNAGAWGGSGLGESESSFSPNATGMLSIDTSTVNPNNVSVATAQAMAAQADAAVAASRTASAMQVLGAMFIGAPMGLLGMTLGAAAALGKQAIANYSKDPTGVMANITSQLNQIAANPQTTNATTGQTTNTTSGLTDTSARGGEAVWDGKSFVSPTSSTGKQAIATATNQGQSTMAQSGLLTGLDPSSMNVEQRLQYAQLQMLNQQQDESQALNKLVYQSAGLIKDPTTGEWRKANETEKRSFMTDTEAKEYDIYLQQLERQKKAMAGELPISPALERELTDWDAQTKESLSRKLGTNYDATTPGIQSLARLQERTGLLREEARRGEITAGSSRVLDWRNALNSNTSLATYSGLPTRTSSILTGMSNLYTPMAANSAANARSSQILQQDAYNQRQQQKTTEQQNKYSLYGSLARYMSE